VTYIKAGKQCRLVMSWFECLVIVCNCTRNCTNVSMSVILSCLSVCLSVPGETYGLVTFLVGLCIMQMVDGPFADGPQLGF